MKVRGFAVAVTMVFLSGVGAMFVLWYLPASLDVVFFMWLVYCVMMVLADLVGDKDWWMDP